MTRSPLVLAALSTQALHGLAAVGVEAVRERGDVDAALVTDADGGRWVVRAPRSAAAGAALEAEVAVLRLLAPYVDAGVLPFTIPVPEGFAPLPEGGRAVVHAPLDGEPVDLSLLSAGPGLAADLGRVVAAVHELPLTVAADVGLPVYSAEDYRLRRLSEVDEAARTGHVPTVLLERWEAALEDVTLWRFQPVVVHGDLGPEQVLTRGTRVRAVTGWSDVSVADPADDLAWLLVAAPADAAESILEAYRLRRTDLADPHLEDRALLVGELELARWLLHGVRTGQDDVVDDAVEMLHELAVAVAAG
ncbi:phosphotransferase [Luteimicrobium subarcticum]|uniref:Aminoglycoside phosphotransferase (APT) family kinase protein n=1 Tax=Luteimicrobium subarcticum TaxID=620910 RepID=A0A2M8WV13_9MICO|nr:phosphotransferase [Luteimicrobium subarcticum]PJI94749.1 aminoglycoside phosphotransferase (APT) family kinase protein [Luteimicrobium subarcticum]